eukprot:TRINITY_DN4763_c2_g2_i20.p1 TRINITY_DN4763_c2_g2~~TRINITY_DN4763_c2_g2_i20.p1  ORF type:complete len:276 (-),score=27.48 TRINITY_DN4763_c2_g2_i20:68-811(-)
MPQALLEASCLVLNTRNKFVWLALFTSICRMVGIRLIRKKVAKMIETGRHELIPRWWKLNRCSTDFSNGLSVFWMAVENRLTKEAKEILKSFDRPLVELDAVVAGGLIGPLIRGIPSRISIIKIGFRDAVASDCSHLPALNQWRSSQRHSLQTADGSVIDVANAEHISKCRYIRELIFSENCTVGNEAIAQLSSMRWLTHIEFLGSNNLGVNECMALAKIQSLTNLNFGSNKIGANAAEHISKLGSR